MQCCLVCGGHATVRIATHQILCVLLDVTAPDCRTNYMCLHDYRFAVVFCLLILGVLQMDELWAEHAWRQVSHFLPHASCGPACDFLCQLIMFTIATLYIYTKPKIKHMATGDVPPAELPTEVQLSEASLEQITRGMQCIVG